MDIETLAIVCAALGIVGTLVFWVAAFFGLRTLRDVRRFLRRPPGDRG